jgi:hypothetical protein
MLSVLLLLIILFIWIRSVTGVYRSMIGWSSQNYVNTYNNNYIIFNSYKKFKVIRAPAAKAGGPDDSNVMDSIIPGGCPGVFLLQLLM